MDSQIYRIISDKISKIYPQRIKELPLLLATPFLNKSENYIKDIKSFIENMSHKFILSSNNISPIFKQLILNNHTLIFQQRSNIDDKSNNIVFVNYLSDNLLTNNNNLREPLWVYSVVIFILESSAHFGLCNNRFEQYIKSAAHLAAEAILKQIYSLKEEDALLIVGYLRSAYILSQTTEGVKDLAYSMFTQNRTSSYKFRISDKTIDLIMPTSNLFIVD